MQPLQVVAALARARVHDRRNVVGRAERQHRPVRRQGHAVDRTRVQPLQVVAS
jgi:hypothetical protein